MLVISPEEALAGREYAIVTIKDDPRKIYDLYSDAEIAQRICDDLNIRYREAVEDPITGEVTFKNVYDVALIHTPDLITDIIPSFIRNTMD